MSPFIVTGLQRLLDKESAKAGTVEEKVAFDDVSRFQCHRLDEARVWALIDLVNDAFNPFDTSRLAKASEVLCIKTCVKVVGIGNTCKVSPG